MTTDCHFKIVGQVGILPILPLFMSALCPVVLPSIERKREM